ncbi:hypothetical protein [Sphingomonas hengshuiensis]|uniref:hypothetical protein n=1 Tax=Sphingomonas hengshuiensis TaxID=1609977 RepID=UPI0005C86870|nr:hypothetical protein [Sphingomonas hengshuiensis]
MLKLAVSAAFAVAMVASPALAEEWDFVLINGAGKAIKTVEVAPTGTTTWQANKKDEDVKHEAEVKAGGRMTVHFDKGSECRYDVKVTFADDSTGVWARINLCDNSYVTVKYNAAGAPVATAS